MELKSLETTLDEIKKVKKDNNILIPLGNNIFIKGKLELPLNILEQSWVLSKFLM